MKRFIGLLAMALVPALFVACSSPPAETSNGTAENQALRIDLSAYAPMYDTVVIGYACKDYAITESAKLSLPATNGTIEVSESMLVCDDYETLGNYLEAFEDADHNTDDLQVIPVYSLILSNSQNTAVHAITLAPVLDGAIELVPFFSFGAGYFIYSEHDPAHPSQVALDVNLDIQPGWQLLQVTTEGNTDVGRVAPANNLSWQEVMLN